jgi:hypothetical protein
MGEKDEVSKYRGRLMKTRTKLKMSRMEDGDVSTKREGACRGKMKKREGSVASQWQVWQRRWIFK